jgi:hypothetical protein
VKRFNRLVASGSKFQSDMMTILKQVLALVLASGIVALGFPPAAGSPEFVGDRAGKTTAEEAARYESPPAPLSPAFTHSIGFAALISDTTEAVFEDEEEDRNLAKELTVWIIGAAFVGYFIVKVFLQGDTDEAPPPDTGKQPPPQNLAW